MKLAVGLGLVLLLFPASSPSGAEISLSENLRSVLPEYSGQQVLTAFSFADSDHAILEIPDDFKKVAQVYKRHFVERGWG